MIGCVAAQVSVDDDHLCLPESIGEAVDPGWREGARRRAVVQTGQEIGISANDRNICRRPLAQVLMAPEMSTPIAPVCSMIERPKSSSQIAVISAVDIPSRTRFSAMLRPTPPALIQIRAAFDVPGVKSRTSRPLISIEDDPTTTTFGADIMPTPLNRDPKSTHGSRLCFMAAPLPWRHTKDDPCIHPSRRSRCQQALRWPLAARNPFSASPNG